MPDQRGFGNHGTEPPRPCQSDDGDDHMKEQVAKHSLKQLSYSSILDSMFQKAVAPDAP